MVVLVIVVEEREYELLNGLVDLNREIPTRPLKIMKNGERVRDVYLVDAYPLLV
jgi:hypothetical protein